MHLTSSHFMIKKLYKLKLLLLIIKLLLLIKKNEMLLEEVKCK